MLLALTIALLFAPLPQPAFAERAAFGLCPPRGERTTCVVDGDTFWLHGVKFRIEDVDTPERHARCASEGDLAERARLRLQQILSASDFQLVTHGGEAVDYFGRQLATVEVGGRSIAVILIAEGLARPWTGHREPWCGTALR